MIQRNAIRHDDNDPVWWIIGDVLRWLWPKLRGLIVLVVVAGLVTFVLLMLI